MTSSNDAVLTVNRLLSITTSVQSRLYDTLIASAGVTGAILETGRILQYGEGSQVATSTVAKYSLHKTKHLQRRKGEGLRGQLESSILNYRRSVSARPQVGCFPLNLTVALFWVTASQHTCSLRCCGMCLEFPESLRLSQAGWRQSQPSKDAPRAAENRLNLRVYTKPLP